MSNLVNFEVVEIDNVDGYVTLESEDGRKIEMTTKYLPKNLREGRFLRFVISHTDYSPDEETDLHIKGTTRPAEAQPNGKQLSY